MRCGLCEVDQDQDMFERLGSRRIFSLGEMTFDLRFM